jgi:heme exporter protein C
MWKFLYALASPRSFYGFAGKAITICYALSSILFSIGLIWGLFISPSDYQQGDAFRIIYIHVPAAFLSMFILGFMTFQAVLLSIWRIKVAGIMLKNAAFIGTWMTFIALFTGALWGKPMWGTWWIWDARLTSELVLLFIYIGLLALFNAVSNYDKALRLMALMTFIGVLDLPIIHYSVYWWNTLHQGQTLTLFAKPKIATSMLYPLLIMIVAFMTYFFALVFQLSRDEVLWRDKKSRWVIELLREKK